MERVQKREQGIKVRGWEERQPSLAPKPKILSKRCHSTDPFPKLPKCALTETSFSLNTRGGSRKLLGFASLRSLSQGHLFMKNKWPFVTESSDISWKIHLTDYSRKTFLAPVLIPFSHCPPFPLNMGHILQPWLRS